MAPPRQKSFLQHPLPFWGRIVPVFEAVSCVVSNWLQRSYGLSQHVPHWWREVTANAGQFNTLSAKELRMASRDGTFFGGLRASHICKKGSRPESSTPDNVWVGMPQHGIMGRVEAIAAGMIPAAPRGTAPFSRPCCAVCPRKLGQSPIPPVGRRRHGEQDNGSRAG
jgi:hypothetical protein